MGTLIERSTLRTILLELLIKDSSLALDIFQTIVKEDPLFLEKVSLNNQALLDEPAPNGDYRRMRLDNIIDEDFIEYNEVFKALAYT